MKCPVCGGKQIGKINHANYYCHDCYFEFNDHKEVFLIGEDGNLSRGMNIDHLSASSLL